MSQRTQVGNAFVFAVCGPGECIDQLHYSLRALRSVSRSRIVVVTDSRRNERRIGWDDVIDVSTPSALDHHQASIYLKIGFHRLLPDGPRYCYLDSDVVALRPEVDEVFWHKTDPVAFGADHITLSEFSPYAVHCGCVERHRSDLRELEQMLAIMSGRPLGRCNSPEPWPPTQGARARSLTERILGRILFHPAAPNGHPRKPERELWQADAENGEVPAQYARWTRDPISERWYSPEGHEVHTVRCDHLLGCIRQKFGISVRDPNWQHWNGGVFVFDSRAHDFLEAWHRKTMAIFDDPAWRTRDQGTLAATVWEFGLQDSALLHKEFNLIVDCYRAGRNRISVDGFQVSNDNFGTSTKASMIHVLHRFGDKEWDIWDWVDRQVQNHRIASRNTHLSDRELLPVLVNPGPSVS